MPTVSLTVTGSPDEIAPLLQQLLRQVGRAQDGSEARPREATVWTAQEFSDIWFTLSEGARKALAEMATRPDGYPGEELATALGMDLVTLGGYLSSISHRLRGREDRPPLYVRNAATGWKFAMPADVAQWIRESGTDAPIRPMPVPSDRGDRDAQPATTYENARLTFRADRIERLEPGQSFRVITREGTFQMTKEQFYRDFANVAASSSYRDQGTYNYKVLPRKALRYRVEAT
jgi:hypothetical protein